MMRLKLMLLGICCFLLVAVTMFSASVLAQDENRAPFVSNIHAEQRTGTKLVDITYDVSDSDGDLLTITVSVSDDGGSTFSIPAAFTGDVGSGIAPGTGKQIVWDAGADVPEVYVANYRIKITARDGQAPRTFNNAWPMAMHDSMNTNRSPYAGPGAGNIKWRRQLPDAGGVHLRLIAGDNGTVYVSSAKSLYIFNRDGDIEFVFNPMGDNMNEILMLDPEGTIYNRNRSRLSAYYYDGTPKWEYKHWTDFNSYSSAITGKSGNIYFAAGLDLIAVDPNGGFLWNYRVGEDITAETPAIGTDGTIYVRGRGDWLCAVYENGAEKWRKKLGSNESHTRASPVIGKDGTIYTFGITDPEVALHDPSTHGGMALYAIRPDGVVKWAYNGISAVYSTPAIASDGTIYIADVVRNAFFKPRGISAIDPSGITKWTFLIDQVTNYFDNSPIVDRNGTIYFASDEDDSSLYAISPDGDLEWKMMMSAPALYSPVIGGDGLLYIATQDGYLYAIGQ